ncbi:MAG TPA: triphosphoribosyl-dephospho-CoA synthase [Burkholderiales bacterium]|nr:triphosphoribosyl-dephospho-CoA synthase [Burkholderiales bacterium]
MTAAGRALDANAVARAIREACVAEVRAFKPGNVSIDSPGHGMRAEDFIASAHAATPSLAKPGIAVGERILRAIEATREVVPFNTNLGIVLLCAPLAHAALLTLPEARLRDRLAVVLAALDVRDAQAAYRAIRLAQPGGLGRSPRHDVNAVPSVTLLEAMREAAQRDRIASQFDTVFADIFEIGTPIAREFLARWNALEWAAVGVYMTLLARFPDSHVARKFGPGTARHVVRDAQPAARMLAEARRPEEAMPALEALDRSLKERAINPGTSADMTVASLVAMALEDLLAEVYHPLQAAARAGE